MSLNGLRGNNFAHPRVIKVNSIVTKRTRNFLIPLLRFVSPPSREIVKLKLQRDESLNPMHFCYGGYFADGNDENGRECNNERRKRRRSEGEGEGEVKDGRLNLHRLRGVTI